MDVYVDTHTGENNCYVLRRLLRQADSGCAAHEQEARYGAAWQPEKLVCDGLGGIHLSLTLEGCPRGLQHKMGRTEILFRSLVGFVYSAINYYRCCCWPPYIQQAW